MNSTGLYVVAAPSGGGKTSLIKALLEKDERVSLSVSYTTRVARPGEQDGVHYHFVDDSTFIGLIEKNAFLEHAEVFGNRYGTERDAVEKKLRAGFDVLLDIDWQGARQIRKSFPSCCTIFILPPSLEALHNRLARRGQDSAAVIEKRMREARTEISHSSEFDYLIINDDFDQALTDLHSIIRHRKLQRPEQKKHYQDLLAELQENG
ncbi:MAG: guanylate kinase [Xanthomonadales bacterium]